MENTLESDAEDSITSPDPLMETEDFEFEQTEIEQLKDIENNNRKVLFYARLIFILLLITCSASLYN